MKGLLKGVGMGVAWGAALLVPFPLLVGGVLAVGLSQRKKPESNLTPEQQDMATQAGVDLDSPETIAALGRSLNQLGPRRLVAVLEADGQAARVVRAALAELDRAAG